MIGSLLLECDCNLATYHHQSQVPIDQTDTWTWGECTEQRTCTGIAKGPASDSAAHVQLKCTRSVVIAATGIGDRDIPALCDYRLIGQNGYASSAPRAVPRVRNVKAKRYHGISVVVALRGRKV